MLIGQHQKNNDTTYIQTINFTIIDPYSIKIIDDNENTSFYYYVKIKFEKQNNLQNIKIHATDANIAPGS